MKIYINIIKQATIVLLSILFVGSLAANSSAAFLKSSFGAKANALGGAYGATVKDPSSLFYNPAGLANINGETRTIKKIDDSKDIDDAFNDPEFDALENEGEESSKKKKKDKIEKIENEPEIIIVKSFEMQFYAGMAQLSLDRSIGFSGLAFTALGGTIGVGALGTQVKGIEGYSETGTFNGGIDYRAAGAYIGYGIETISDTRIGISAMGFKEDLAGAEVFGGGLNVGAQKVVFPVPLIEIGLDIKNLLGAAENSSTAVEAGNVQKLDTILSASLSVTSPPPNASAKLLLGFDVNLDAPGDAGGFQGNIGLAVTVTNFAFVMAGFKGGDFGVGFGVYFKNMQLAYAINRDSIGQGFQHFVEANFVL